MENEHDYVAHNRTGPKTPQSPRWQPGHVAYLITFPERTHLIGWVVFELVRYKKL